MAGTFKIDKFKLINQVSGIALASYVDLDRVKADYPDPGFFNTVASQLKQGSVLITTASDGQALYAVSTNQDNDVVLVSLAAGAAVEAAIASLVAKAYTKGSAGAIFTCSLVGTTFTSAALAQTIANYTVVAGTTGLTLASASLTDANSVDLTFTGTVAAGTLTITPKAAALKNALDAVAATFTIV
jgi:hypothetical protein